MQKYQLYDQLSINIMNNDENRVIDNVRDLSLIKGEINNLINSCIDMYNKSHLTRNLWILRKICSDIQVLLNINRKNITNNPLFNSLISEIFLLLSTIKYKPSSFTDGNHESIESYIFSYVNATAVKEFQDQCPEEVRTYMGILLACVKKGDKKGVRKILDYLLYDKEVIVSNEIDYDGISHIKDIMRADVVWYLWKLLLYNVAKSKEEREFCKLHLFLYTLFFQKKHRNLRLNMLYFCFLTFTSRKSIKVKEVKLKSGKFEQHQIESKKPATKTKNNSNKAAVSNDDTNNNLDYLKCIVYKHSIDN